MSHSYSDLSVQLSKAHNTILDVLTELYKKVSMENQYAQTFSDEDEETLFEKINDLRDVVNSNTTVIAEILSSAEDSTSMEIEEKMSVDAVNAYRKNIKTGVMQVVSPSKQQGAKQRWETFVNSLKNKETSDLESILEIHRELKIPGSADMMSAIETELKSRT